MKISADVYISTVVNYDGKEIHVLTTQSSFRNLVRCLRVAGAEEWEIALTMEEIKRKASAERNFYRRILSICCGLGF